MIMVKSNSKRVRDVTGKHQYVSGKYILGKYVLGKYVMKIVGNELMD